MFQSISQDVAYALRSLAGRRGFATAALVTLALGIGANTAIFSVVHAVLIRDLPYPDADRVVRVYATHRQFDFRRGVMNPFDFTYWNERTTTFEETSLDVSCRTTLTGAFDPVRVRCAEVSPSFFGVLGTHPIAGRLFTADEARESAAVVVISAELWTSRFGGRADIVNSLIRLDDEPWRVVGVMPDDFAFPREVEVWRPFELTTAQRADMGSFFLGAMARLKPGVSMEEAQAELDRFGADLESAYPASRANRGFFVAGLQDELGFQAASGLRLLQGVVVFVLLIACANVANLSLAQATARRREFGVRAALGGSRSRLIRQSLTESLVLAALGASLGILLAAGGVRVLVALAPGYLLPDAGTIGISWPVLGTTAIIAGLTGLLFGVAPALMSARPNLSRSLEQGLRTAAGGLSWSRRGRLRSGLVAIEVAMALVLLTGAGLLVRSFTHLVNQPTGFRSDHVLTAQITLPATRYPDADIRSAFWSELVNRLGRLPGTIDAAGSSALPFSLWEWQTAFTVQGREDVPNNGAGIRTVTPDLFDTLGIPLLAGRAFSLSSIRLDNS
jgi:putative ABC transport system permease protein